MRRLLLALSLASLLLPSLAAATSAANVRLPKNAADWATFTPVERAAAYGYLAAERERLLASGQAKWIIGASGAAQAVSGASGQPVAAAGAWPAVYGGECSISYIVLPGAVEVRSSAKTYAQPPSGDPTSYYVDTGASGYVDAWYKAGALLQTFSASGTNFVRYDAGPSYTWVWEGRKTYTINSYHTIWIRPSGPYVWHNAFCTLSWVANGAGG